MRSPVEIPGGRTWVAAVVAVMALGVACSRRDPSPEARPAPVIASAADAEPWGEVARVPEAPRDHWVWVNDRVLRHSELFDGDTGEMLGAVDSGLGLASRPPYVSRERGEVYVVETFYERGQRGPRFDQVAIYDDRTLAVVGEVGIPPKAADVGQGIALAAVLDGGRFFAVLNQSPGSSVSIVDLERRQFVEEIVTGGCAMIYPVGPRRFGMLCANGTALQVEVDDSGRLVRTAESEPFFDVVRDPVTTAGVRDGATWTFASFEGWLHAVDFSGDRPVAAEPWSLFDDHEREEGWRVGGIQHLALHRPSHRLYSVVHQGGPGTHKDAGPEIWVYDLETRAKVAEMNAPNVLLAFVRPFVGVRWGGIGYAILDAVVPAPGVHTIEVTQDDAPLLFARNADLGAVGILDARTGDHVGNLEEVGLSGPVLVLP